MARTARLLIAEGDKPHTARMMVDRCGFKSPEYVYRAMRAGGEMDGKRWRWMTRSEMEAVPPGEAEATFNHTPRDVIVCDCARCGGRQWTPAEIRSLNSLIADTPVQRSNIAKINAATDHRFAYLERPVAGKWSQQCHDGHNGNGKASLPGHDARRLPRSVLPDRPTVTSAFGSPWMPVNPKGPGSELTSSVGVPRQ